MMQETVLDLVEYGIAPGSGRALTQTLRPIRSGSLRRLANGELVARVRKSLQKYQLSINFSDVFPPAFGALWEGDAVTVHSAVEIQQKADVEFERDPVPGSVVWRDAKGKQIPVELGEDDDETEPPEGAVWVMYRPVLDCLVEGWDLDRDEYGEVVSATLNLQEV